MEIGLNILEVVKDENWVPPDLTENTKKKRLTINFNNKLIKDIR